MITILGAGGAIGNELAKLLAARRQPFRLVARNPARAPGANEVVAADLTDRDQTIRAIAGSSAVYLVAGLKYDIRVWREMWPRIMDNVIEGSKRAGARLAFLDNVYMYGRVTGSMTEETPFNPCSKKGEIRAKIATTLMNAWESGALTAMIARSADFYGPDVRTGVPNVIVFAPLAAGRKASCLVNARLPHSYSFVPDAARSLLDLAELPSAWNQTWHVPTSPNPPTGQELIELAAQALAVSPRYRVLHRPLLRLAGIFSPELGEMYEMLYQNDSHYIFDSSKYSRALGFTGTPYADGIRATASSFGPEARAKKR